MYIEKEMKNAILSAPKFIDARSAKRWLVEMFGDKYLVPIHSNIPGTQRYLVIVDILDVMGNPHRAGVAEYYEVTVGKNGEITLRV